ncbi:MAG: BCCT family transporter [Pseudomonadota bacterium]
MGATHSNDPINRGHLIGARYVVHGPIFLSSALLLIAFVVLSLIAPSPTTQVFALLKTTVTTSFDWVLMIAAAAALLLCGGIAASPFGRIRLGGETAKPRYSTFSWVAMLFAAGVGTGMMFYGTAEPAAYYTAWAGAPLNSIPRTLEAERLAFSAALFHWGLTPWALYAITGLALAFSHFNCGLPLAIRSAFYPALGNRIFAWPGFAIDVCAVLATVFGLATTLGFGATLAASGLSYSFGVPNTMFMQITIICVVTMAATLSVVLGLDNGIRRLSLVNIWLAAALLLFILIAGPTGAAFQTMLQTALDYPKDLLALSSWIGRDDQQFYQGWTLLYWAWWIAWAPFVGMFIARISYGRSIRVFLLNVVVLPTFVGLVWFSAFGKAAIHQIQAGIGALASGVDKDYLVIWQTLEALPFAPITTLLALTLLFVFFISSSDSGSLVADSMTAGGQEDAPVAQRVFWAVLEGLVAIALLLGGGAGALGSLQNAVIAAGLPFAVIVVASGLCLIAALRQYSK